jgi:hypothetical protein
MDWLWILENLFVIYRQINKNKTMDNKIWRVIFFLSVKRKVDE